MSLNVESVHFSVINNEQGLNHPVAYFICKLLQREENYLAIEKECLTVKLGIEAFKVYLLENMLTVQIDHHAPKWLDHSKKINARLTR